jgi:adenylate cyclase
MGVVVGTSSAVRHRFAGYVLDLSRSCLLRGTEPIALRPRSFDLLRYLVEHPDRVVTRDELLRALWPQVVVTDESLTHCVGDVRAALNDDGHRIVRTVPRRGYLFAAHVHSDCSGDDYAAAPVAALLRTEVSPVRALPLIGRDEDLALCGALLAAA